MYHRLVVLPALAVMVALPVAAQDAGTVADLHAALKLPELIGVMRDEGLAYGDQIAADLFPAAPPSEWSDVVAAIYDADRMNGRVLASLEATLAGQDLAPMLAFFQSEPGATLIALEASARAALLDDSIEQAAKEAAAVALADQTPREQLIARFVAVNDLIETNVVSAMNANYAFYMGLMDGGALAGEMTEDQILADVWAQEAQIRATTTEWVYAFLLLAYDPAADVDLEAYIAFSETGPGQVLNQAIFTAFDQMFADISRALGQASARFMVTQEL